MKRADRVLKETPCTKCRRPTYFTGRRPRGGIALCTKCVLASFGIGLGVDDEADDGEGEETS